MRTEVIEDAFARKNHLTSAEIKELAPEVEAGMRALDRGDLRAARPHGRTWVADRSVKQLILLSFALQGSSLAFSGEGRPRTFDKIPLKFEEWDEPTFEDSRLRVVPGAVVRQGAHIGPGAVLMPCFVNVGAYVDEGTMVDTWSTVGSCAQVGKRCHISGGVGIGGVLEPIGDRPVVIEDRVFVGARSEIAEGVIVRSGAVIGMGVYLGRSTPIIDRASGEIAYGEVPEDAVVVAGTRPDPMSGLSLYCAVIVKYVNQATRDKTTLDDIFRTSTPLGGATS